MKVKIPLAMLPILLLGCAPRPEEPPIAPEPPNMATLAEVEVALAEAAPAPPAPKPEPVIVEEPPKDPTALRYYGHVRQTSGELVIKREEGGWLVIHRVIRDFNKEYYGERDQSESMAESSMFWPDPDHKIDWDKKAEGILDCFY